MDREIVIGCVVLVVAVSLILTLTFWSRQRIERIARQGYRTAREVLKEKNLG